jgi:hypothetical protein
MPPIRCVIWEQSYDFSTGELSSKFIFAASRNAVHCEVLTFASRDDPTRLPGAFAHGGKGSKQ